MGGCAATKPAIPIATSLLDVDGDFQEVTRPSLVSLVDVDESFREDLSTKKKKKTSRNCNVSAGTPRDHPLTKFRRSYRRSEIEREIALHRKSIRHLQKVIKNCSAPTQNDSFVTDWKSTIVADRRSTRSLTRKVVDKRH